jgi:hypothetical protein
MDRPREIITWGLFILLLGILLDSVRSSVKEENNEEII